MSLDTQLKQQFAEYLTMLESPVIFRASLDDSDASGKVRAFLDDIVAMSDQLSIEETTLEWTPSFTVDRASAEPSGIVFAGVPLGHEFASFVLALLQVAGRAPKIDDAQKQRILSISEPRHFTTYVSLSCHNCPDVVQAFNIMAVLNPLISHTMVEGGLFREQVEAKGIMAVPAIYEGSTSIANGRQTLDDLLDLIAGEVDDMDEDIAPFDVLIVGGGPAGQAAAIYAARKGIRTGIVAKQFGGQVNDTASIENFIGIPYIEGPELMQRFRQHVETHENISLISGRDAVELKQPEGQLHQVRLDNGRTLESKTVILATGARWKNINVPGEAEFKTKGVAYCPHCDGPLFKGKRVAVIGGGNSGVEAAIDLANMTEHVTLLEFLPELKADQILQDRLKTLSNVDVITSAATTEITGTDRVNGIRFKHRETDQEEHRELEGVFVQIGLMPNTEWLKDTLEINRFGEIVIDPKGATSLPGVYAAGDCTTVAYKQVVISVGSGATAALGAFDYLIRNT